MYIICVYFLTFCIIWNALSAFAQEDFDIFDVNEVNENFFLDTIPTDGWVTTDASPVTINSGNFGFDLSPETQNDFLTASNDECLSSSDTPFSSSIFRTRSLFSKREGFCSNSDSPRSDSPKDMKAVIEHLGIEEGVSECWCPSALVTSISALIGGFPIIPVCWTPATLIMPTDFANPVLFTAPNGGLEYFRHLESCTLRKLLPSSLVVFPHLVYISMMGIKKINLLKDISSLD